MAYSDFAPARRSRRRRNVIIVILALFIVGVLVLAVRYRTEQRESIDYVTNAEEVALTHAEMSEQLGELLQGLGEEDRPALELRLESLAGSADEATKQLEEQTVSRPVAAMSGYMTVAIESWEDGINALGAAIVAVLDADPNDVNADEQLREAIELIRLGDRAYANVAEEVAALDPDIAPEVFPEVGYANGQFGPLYDPAVVAERLRALGTLAELVDIALVAITIPEPVSVDDADIRTIPFSESLALEVTVSNTGNVVVEEVAILVTLQQVGSGEAIEPLGQLIPSIEPGASEIALFPNLNATPGEVYSLTATATVSGSDDPTDDNTFNLVFQRNSE